MASYELIIFDLDGTLLDSLAHIVHCARETAISLGEAPPEDRFIREGIGLTVEDQVNRLFPNFDLGKKQQFLDVFKACYYGSSQQHTLFTGVVKTLRDLQTRGIHTGVATGMSRRGLQTVLENTELGELIGYTRCADECHAKPNPEMVQELMDYFGVSPEHTLMVGDTQYDVQAAQNAGVGAIVVNYGAHDVARLKPLAPLGIIENIEQVLQYL